MIAIYYIYIYVVDALLTQGIGEKRSKHFEPASSTSYFFRHWTYVSDVPYWLVV